MITRQWPGLGSFGGLLYVGCLLGPIFARLLLPARVEAFLTLRFFGMPFFAIDACWVVLPLITSLLGVRLQTRGILIAVYYAALGTVFFGHIVLAGTAPPVQVAGLIDTFLPLIVMALFPLRLVIFSSLRILLGVVFVAICVEIALFSISPDLWDANIAREDFGLGISRISTTVGAATGTGIVLYLLAAWLIDLVRDSKALTFAVLALGGVAIGFTMSRGSLLAYALYSACVIISMVRTDGVSVRSFLFMASAAVLLVFGLESALGRSFTERFSRVGALGDFSTGRHERLASGLELFRSKPLFGYGWGSVVLCNRVATVDLQRFPELAAVPETLRSPHNAYLGSLGEVGIVGAIFFWAPLFFVFVRNAWRSQSRPLWFGLGGVFGILMNVESIVLSFEYIALVVLLLFWLDRGEGFLADKAMHRRYCKNAPTGSPVLRGANVCSIV